MIAVRSIPRPAGLGARSAELQDDFAPMRAAAMLGDVNTLPGAERQIAIADRHL